MASLSIQPATASPATSQMAARKLGRASDARPAGLKESAAWRELGRGVDASDPRQRREAAIGMASELFFGPLLAEMQKLPFGKTFANGGRMEEAFSQQLHTRIADHVAASDPGGLLTLLEARLQRVTPTASDAVEPAA